MHRILIKIIILIILPCLILMGNQGLSLTHTKTITVRSIDELNRKIQNINPDVPQTIVLASGRYVLKENQIPVVLPSNVTLSGYDAVLESDYESPIFVIGKDYSILIDEEASIDSWKLLPNDVNIPLHSMDFTVPVKDSGTYAPGMSVYLSDDRSGEYNEIAAIAEGAVVLAARPVNEYLTQYQARMEPDEPTRDTKIEGFQMVLKTDEPFELEDADFWRAAVIISHCASVSLRDITIKNKNSKMISISALTSDYTLMQNIEITGGGIGIFLTPYASGTIVENSRIYDGADSMHIAGSRNRISRNTISSSGKTLGWGDGINFSGYASYNVLEGNLIEGGNCYGMWFTVEDNARGNVIANNTINSNITYGLNIEKGSGYIVTGNQFMRNSGGIGLSALVTDSIINNNYIADNIVVGIILDKPRGIQIRDNIVNRNGIEVNHNEIGYDGSIVVLEGSIEAEENIVDVPIKQLNP